MPTETEQTLILDDGTQTQVSQDSSDENAGLRDQGLYFKFEQGNFETLALFAQQLTNKVSVIKQTILPLLHVAMIELLQTDSSVEYKAFESQFSIENSNIFIHTNIILTTHRWIGSDIKQEDVRHDSNYVLNRLNVVPGVRWEHCIIDTSVGSLTVTFTL